MRVIKFRVWSKLEKKMYPVSDISFGDDGAALTVIFHTEQRGPYFHDSVDGESGILMQFTGFKDKNGAEIYEGDIVEYLDNTSQGLIKKTMAIEDIRHLPDFSCSKWQAVIGNIYEHAGLLVWEKGTTT